MNTKLLIVGITLLLLNSCATQPQSVWYKSGSSAQEFEMEKGQCNAQAFSLANGNLYQIAIIQNQCLQGKGWYLVDPNQIANANNALTTERNNNKKLVESICANAEFAPIYAKTACFSSNIEFKHMTDETKITAPQKAVFVKWREAIDSSIQQAANNESRLNGNAGKKLANYLLTTYKIENDKNNLDLYSGKITWGQYNSKRKEIQSKIADATK